MPIETISDRKGRNLARDICLVDSLLDPLTRTRFISEYWAKKAVHISGNPNRLEPVFDKTRFFAAIAKARQSGESGNFSVDKFIQDFDGSWTCSESIGSDDIDDLVRNRTTVCVRAIVNGDNALRDFGESFKRALGLVGSISFNCYYSGDASGADTHFDCSVTTALQIEGSKRWRFATRSVLPWPPGNARMQKDGTPQWVLPWLGGRGWDVLSPQQMDFEEVVLEAGDILCLPAGTWHSAKADGHSLALNMTYLPLPMCTIVERVLAFAFASRPEWRGGIPPTANVEDFDADGAPDHVIRYLQDCLADVRNVVMNGGLAQSQSTLLWRTELDLSDDGPTS